MKKIAMQDSRVLETAVQPHSGGHEAPRPRDSTPPAAPGCTRDRPDRPDGLASVCWAAGEPVRASLTVGRAAVARQ